MNSQATFFYGLLHMDTPVLANEQKLNSVSLRELTKSDAW